jgi:ankyrin repeat protein
MTSLKKSKPVKKALKVAAVFLIVVACAFYRVYRQASLNSGLIEAVKLGYEAEVTSLLEQGADPNTRDGAHAPNPSEWFQNLVIGASTDKPEDHTPAIVLAANVNGNLTTVQMLVKHGANIRAVGPNGMDALSAASEVNDVNMVRYLHLKGLPFSTSFVGGPPMAMAIKLRRYDMLRYLISAGDNVNSVANGAGRKPLAYAKELHWEQIADMLVQAGAK